MANTPFEPRVGDKISLVCVEDNCNYAESCGKCFFQRYDCLFVVCNPRDRVDGKSVHFEEIKVEDNNL